MCPAIVGTVWDHIKTKISISAIMTVFLRSFLMVCVQYMMREILH